MELELDLSLRPNLEATPQQVEGLLIAVEAFDPKSIRAEEVPLVAPIALHASPYVSENTPALLRAVNPYRQHVYQTDGVKRHHLGGVRLTAAADPRYITSSEPYTDALVHIIYDAYYPVPGAEGNVHQSLFVSKGVMFEFIGPDSSSWSHGIAEQRRRDGLSLDLPMVDQRTVAARALSILRRPRQSPVQSEHPSVTYARESWVGADELEAVTTIVNLAAMRRISG